MAFTEADCATLRGAIARGEKMVVFSDRTVIYRSVGELVEALHLAEAELATRPRHSLGRAEKGF